MKFQIALWIWMLHIHPSICKESHCYQAEHIFLTGEHKVRQRRSLLSSSQALKSKESQLCSTWGNFHFRTFDGEIYRFPGLCNYLLASHCGRHYEDFNIQIQQAKINDLPTISQLSLNINELLIEIIDHVPFIHGQRLKLPYIDNGIQIEKNDDTLKISIKLMLDISWEQNNTIHIFLNRKYAGETCGLCGNFNDNPSDDLVYNGLSVDPLMFGQLQKLRKPEETCEDPTPDIGRKCNIYRARCYKQLKSLKWIICNRLVKPEPYIDAFMVDLCLCKGNEKLSSFCLCSTIAEYSRQCALAGGKPPEWRSPTLCYKTCPANLIYQECSPPCTPTCSNPGRQYLCDGPCVAGCVCPKGYVLDDVTNLGCVLIEDCSCIYNNIVYPTESIYSTTCSRCVCSGGHWNCKDLPCPSVCSVEGGSHITTFDKTQYTFHGKCIYVLAKPCANNSFLITAEMKKCAYSETATCLTRVFLFLNNASYAFEINYDNSDFPHVTYEEEVMAKAGVRIDWASSFYMIVYTNLGIYLEVQLTPVMQLYIIIVDPAYKEKMCGLCGNYNSIQKDDFKASSGAVESNVVDFANSWKTQYQCITVLPEHKHPCMYGTEIEKYAHYWCQVLLDDEGPFAPCHTSVSPRDHYQNCLFDTCSCKRADDCLCAALSSYAWDCAVSGVILIGWRENVCRNLIKHCPQTFVFSYNVTYCIPTCRSLTEPDSIRSFTFYTLDGCVCPEGTYLDDRGLCVKKEDCPCYYKGFPVPANEPLHVGRLICNCTKGILNCTETSRPECPPSMVYVDCDQVGEHAKGAQCPQSCDSVQCYSPLCVSGCVCPEELFLSHNGTECVTENLCPCVHNGQHYSPGENATIHCDNCMCSNRTWLCDSKTEKAICTAYGQGHYITFDNKRFTINGNCEYTLVQDYCDINDLENGTFKIITENIPCGTTGTSCSVAITLYLGAHKIILADGHIDVMGTSSNVQIPYITRTMGIYLVIETNIGLVLVWDKMTSISIHLSRSYQGKVCGLCGNFDGNSKNDFTTRSMCLVEDVKLFRDSWKISSDCPEVYISKEPCAIHPYRMPWAHKMCYIIKSDVFAQCHAEVDPEEYYEACVRDTCACDTGGDCNCYCTAVAAYAQACSESCVCVDWRTETVCPLFCDFYNNDRQCQWDYKACGAPCLKTCRNPSGVCHSETKGLEGCYPKCPKERPYFNEDEMQCVADCGCLDNKSNYYKLGEKIESCNICESCICTGKGIQCQYDSDACNCEYQGLAMKIGEIMHLKEGPEDCISIKCGLNGTEEMSCFETTKPTMGAMVSNEKTIYIATSSMLMSSTPFSTLGEESIRVSNISVSNNLGQYLTLSTMHKTSSFTETFPAPRVITKVPTKRAIADSIVALSRPSGLLLSTSKTAETIKPLETFSKPSTNLETSKVTHLLSFPIISRVTTKVDVLTSQLSTVPPTLKLSSSTLSSTGPTITSATSTKVKEVSNHLIPTKELSETTTNQTTVPPSGIPQFIMEKHRALDKIAEAQVSTTGRASATPVSTPSIVSLNKTRIQKLNQYSKQAIYRNNCLNATCYENGTFYISALQCPQVEAITCKYGIPPMKVYDQDGCCFHYKCPSCMGPNGTEKNPGETWIDNCQNCSCDKTWVKIFCSPVACPPLNFSLCQKLWNPYPILTKEDHCCPKIECRCDPSQCTYPTLSCQLGYETVLEIPKGECCMRLKCKPMNVCIVNGTVYQVGKLIWTETSPCQTCRCSNIKDSQTGFNTITCTPIICIKNCSLGFVYEEASTGCCGMCVQVSCVVTTSNGSLLTLQPGNSVSDICTQYTCERMGNSLVTSAQTQICPLLHKEDCESGQYIKTPDGCCNICKDPKLCMIESKLTEISQNGCSGKVHLSYCKGSCWSLSEFSNSSLQMEGKCKCCKEIETFQNVIELTCPGEKNKNITVTSAKSCACTSVKCIP